MYTCMDQRGRRPPNSFSVGSGSQISKWIMGASCQRHLPHSPFLDAKPAEPSRFLAVILSDFHPLPSTIKPPWRQIVFSVDIFRFIGSRSFTLPFVKRLDHFILFLAFL